MVLRDRDKFWPERTNLQTHRRQNLSPVKIWERRLYEQNRNKLVDHLSYKVQQAYVIELKSVY